MAIESGIAKSTINFQLKTPEFSLTKITRVFSISNIAETLFLDGMSMPLGFFDPVYARIRYREIGLNIELLYSLHLTEENAIFDENQIGFSFLTIDNNPLLFPFSSELTIIDGLTAPDVEGVKASIRITGIAGFNKFAVFRCEPGFI